MPRVAAKVIKAKIENGDMLAIVRFDGKLPREGENLKVKWGGTRTLAQNAFLWVYYGWLIKYGGMKEQGFFCPEAIHSSMKSHFISSKIMSKGEWKVLEEGSSTDLNKSQFSEFVEKIDNFICDFFEIDTSSFFQDYADMKGD